MILRKVEKKALPEVAGHVWEQELVNPLQEQVEVRHELSWLELRLHRLRLEWIL